MRARIEHPTGATDIVLRYDVGGGFMIAGWAASQVPIFTLYGDGTVVFRNTTQEMPPAIGQRHARQPAPDRQAQRGADPGPARVRHREQRPGRGSRAVRQPDDHRRRHDDVHDRCRRGQEGRQHLCARHGDRRRARTCPPAAPSTRWPQRLSDFDQGGAIVTDVYAPTAYRGILMDGTGMVDPGIIAWPWADIAPSDFKGPADPNAFQLATAHPDARGGRGARGRRIPRAGSRACSSAAPTARRTRSRCDRSCRTRRE